MSARGRTGAVDVDGIDFGSLKKLSTLITDKLAEEIQSGRLRPGERLIQTELAQRFKVSRVAVRDALQELRRSGLSVNIPLKGDIVRPVSGRQVRDLYAIRKLVEPYAMRRACENIDAAGLARLETIVAEQEQLFAAGDAPAFIQKDWEFHRAIAAFCVNEPLFEIIDGLWARTRQARSVAQSDSTFGPVWERRSIQRHRDMLDTLRRRDGDAAAAVISNVIDEAAAELAAELAKQGWDEA